MRHRGLCSTLLGLIVVVAVAAGCKKAEPTAVVGFPDPAAGGPPGGMTGANELALGTLKLEGTEDAVTPVQAAELLPLWQAIQGGSLQGDAETQAVLKQIESTMTESQLAAIEEMSLTWQDMQAWMQEQGLEVPERRAPGGQDGPGAFQNMSEEERTRVREELQNMTPEQRATRLAEMGIQRPEGAPEGGPGGAPGGAFSRGRIGGADLLLTPLIELLTERAAE